MQKYAEICRNLQKYALSILRKTCKHIKKKCKICKSKIYMQHMQKYALPTLLKTFKLVLSKSGFHWHDDDDIIS